MRLFQIKDQQFINSLTKVFCLFAFFLALLDIFCPEVISLYSGHFALREQTDAFLRGQISLSNNPLDLKHDYLWENGVHQGWGLGVPLLRLPFEFIAQLLGFTGAPDRLVFIFYFLSVCTYLFFSFEKLGNKAVKNRWKLTSICLFSTFLIMFYPGFMTLLKTRFFVYEEVIAYAYLINIFSVFVFLNFLNQRSNKSLFLLGISISLGVYIRPTVVIYSFLLGLFALSTLIRSRESIKKISLFIICSSLGPVGLLALNYIRFNHPLEFGYSINLSTVPVNDFTLRFGNPFKTASLIGASKELFFSFFNTNWNNFSFYQKNIFPSQTNFSRFREFYFETISPRHLYIILISVTILLYKKISPNVLKIVWGLTSAQFIFLFLFYLYSPSLTSRYLSDFLPCFSLLTGLSIFFILFTKKLNNAHYIFLSILFFIFSFDINYPKTSNNHEKSNSTSTLENYRNPTIKPLPKLLGQYLCLGDLKTDPEIHSNLNGWDYSKSCLAKEAVTFFMESVSCVEAFIYSKDSTWIKNVRNKVRMNINSRRMELDEIKLEENNKVIVRFCNPHRVYKNKIVVLTLGLFEPFDLNQPRVYPRLYKLIKVSK